MRILVLGILLSATVANVAQAHDGDFYVGAEFGVTEATSEDLKFTPGATFASTGTVKVDYEHGFDGGAVLGYDFGPVRVEAEASYRSANIGTLDSNFTLGQVFIAGPRSGGGKARALSFMGNAMLDLGKEDGLSFFVGGGAGYAKIRYENVRNSSGTAMLDDRDAGFAWQAIAGVRYAISENIDITAKYRYFNAGEAELVGAGGRAVDAQFRSHSLMGGVTFNFW